MLDEITNGPFGVIHNISLLGNSTPFSLYNKYEIHYVWCKKNSTITFSVGMYLSNILEL